MNIPDSIHEVVAKVLAHLPTLNSDGAPQETVVWVGIGRHSVEVRRSAHANLGFCS